MVVVDLTRVLAGPYCTLVLSNLGARVIKVERPRSGDDARAIGPFVGGKSLYFGSLNHGKESIALDLRDPDDRTVFERLCGAADVLVENYRPGVLNRLGYGWETLQRRWPRLIYAAASGFGRTGPLRERPAFDMVVQAMSGIMSLTGHPDGPPARVGVSIGDIVAGLFLAIGITAALHQRRDTGSGTLIDVAMLDCQLAILESALTTHLVTGALPGRLGTRHPNIVPFQAFEAGDGQPVVLCAALRAHPAAEWLERFERAGIACAPVNSVADAVRNPQVAARHMVLRIPDPAIGDLAVAGNPIKLAGVPDPETRRPPPDLDADRAAILAWLGAQSPSTLQMPEPRDEMNRKTKQ